MQRRRPRQHIRRLDSGKRILVNNKIKTRKIFVVWHDAPFENKERAREIFEDEGFLHNLSLNIKFFQIENPEIPNLLEEDENLSSSLVAVVAGKEKEIDTLFNRIKSMRSFEVSYIR